MEFDKNQEIREALKLQYDSYSAPWIYTEPNHRASKKFCGHFYSTGLALIGLIIAKGLNQILQSVASVLIMAFELLELQTTFRQNLLGK